MSMKIFRQRAVNSRLAFTLVELLVVISIIAILLAVLMPALSGAKRQARKIICGTNMKSVHTAALLYANDENKGRLPQGGYHKIDGTVVYDGDDAIGMIISDFFRLSKYIVQVKGLPTDYDIIMALPPAEKARLAGICIESGAGKVFVCPEMYNAGEPTTDRVTHKPTTTGKVYFRTEDYARIGYCYLAGFETEKWDFNQLGALSNPKVAVWTSPMTLASKGTAVIITDRSRYVPAGQPWDFAGKFEYQHGAHGFKRISGLSADFDHTTIKGGTCVGTFDGAVEFKTFSNTKMRQMYNNTYGNVGTGPAGLNHEDYTFF